MIHERTGDVARCLRDTDLPTPFGAAEIRNATPGGHVVETVTHVDGAVVARRRTTFLEPDESGVTMRLEQLDDDGHESGDPATFRTEWVDLQGHASFAAAVADREWETVETPLGRCECIRYDVSGDDAMTFWFAVDHPGMPVVVKATGNGSVTTTTVVAISAS